MRARISLLFQLRKSKILRNGTSPIYLKVVVEDEKFELSTKRCITPEKWNAIAQKVSGTTEDAKSINAYLKSMEQEVFQAHHELIQENKEVTAVNLKNKLLGLDITRHYVIELFKEHNEKVKALVGKQYAHATFTRFETILKHSQAFLEWKYKVADIDIATLNYEFIENFEFWFKSVRNCDHNSTMKYLASFKKIIKRSLNNGWLQKDPFIDFKLSLHEVKITVLTCEELVLISNKVFDSERVEKVRDIFLFSCYTGLAYADVKKLKRSEISKGIDGKDWIFTSRQKTHTDSRIPLLPEAITIIKKYSDNPQCANKDCVLPVLSNQKMNSYLKEIADLCGIKKRLTYHLARHTFATTVTLSNGVPMETVSKLLGHRNLKTTQHYAKIIDVKVSSDMDTLKKRRLKVTKIK